MARDIFAYLGAKGKNSDPDIPTHKPFDYYPKPQAPPANASANTPMLPRHLSHHANLIGQAGPVEVPGGKGGAIRAIRPIRGSEGYGGVPKLAH